MSFNYAPHATFKETTPNPLVASAARAALETDFLSGVGREASTPRGASFV
jgi:hypothetical protein